jgi:hypothetical protein
MKTPQLPRKMLIVGALGVAAAVGVGAAGSAGAQTGNDTTTTTAKPAADANDAGMRCEGREPLDEATAAKVKAAAEEAVPGATVKKSGHDRDDGYVAMLLKADGTTRVLVHLDKDFKVTKVEDPAPERPGREGREPLDAATAAKVKAAAEKAVPNAEVKKSGHDRSDGYVAMLLKADGTTRVLVHLDKDFKVTDVQDPAPDRPHRGHAGPGRGLGDAGDGATAPAQGASTSL